MANAISLLHEQHVEVSGLLMKLERTNDPVLSRQLFRTIDAELRTHSHIEETIFYPEFRKRAQSRRETKEAEEVPHFLHEHAQVKQTLEQIERAHAGTAQFKALLASLKRLVKEHIAEEESEMFKQARSLFSARELTDFGYLMERAAAQSAPIYEMVKNARLPLRKTTQSAVIDDTKSVSRS